MLELLSEHACFGGMQRYWRHDSREIGLTMRFGVFLPAQAQSGASLPVLIYLAGLTCNEETFATKAGAQRFAARHGLALVTPDTSPRGANVPGEAESWDFGVAAGFYLDAKQPPWSPHWRMESYIVTELLALLAEALPLDVQRCGLFGHSMGGHGALTLALRHPGLFKSVSAFAPIANPTRCPWGERAFTGYLGTDRDRWQTHDATVHHAVCAADAARLGAPAREPAARECTAHPRQRCRAAGAPADSRARIADRAGAVAGSEAAALCQAIKMAERI